MTIDIFTSTGEKNGTQELPAELFEAVINRTLIHQAIVRQRSNARSSIAHAKNRGEVAGSTRKLFAQKHTGRARRGSVRSPVLRGGGKAFGPRSERNFEKDMPRTMRRMALFACLSHQAKSGTIVGLESYPDTVKTKDFVKLLGKMSLKDARKVLIVLPEQHDSLWRSSRNIPGMKTILVSYLNPLDIIDARRIIFVGDSIAKAAAIFGKKENQKVQKKQKGQAGQKEGGVKESKPAAKIRPKKTAVKKSPVRKAKSSVSSDSSK